MDASGGRKRLWVGKLPSSPGDVDVGAGRVGRLLLDAGSRARRTRASRRPIIGMPPKKITNGVHVLTAVSFAKNGQAAAVRSSVKQPGQLVTFAADASRADVRVLVDVNADVLDRRRRSPTPKS